MLGRRGEGISLLHGLDIAECISFSYSHSQPTSRQPLLIGDFKFELLLYCFVRSVRPLREFCFERGLCDSHKAKELGADWTRYVCCFRNMNRIAVSDSRPSVKECDALWTHLELHSSRVTSAAVETVTTIINQANRNARYLCCHAETLERTR